MRILPSGILWVLGGVLLAASAEARGVESTLGALANDTAAICAGLNAAAVDLDTTLYPALQNALSICKKFSPFSSGVQHAVQGATSAASRYGDDVGNNNDNDNLDDDSDDSDNTSTDDTNTAANNTSAADSNDSSESEAQTFADV